jgi:cation diffusion facilitator CzcD-associated flavoprotein CzcO
MQDTTPRPTDHEVVILGAGMSGLCTAIQLKLSGQHDFVVLEKSAGLGGTWWDNRYPGAHVDVPAPLYCFSFEPNPRWQRRFAAAPEIAAYMAHCADKYGITPHLRLNSRITAARFDEGAGRWLIDTVCNGIPGQLSARFFVCSTGPLSQARWPDIPGLESFAGTRLHSSRWDANVPLAGKRVAVIGTGSTAAQLIPPMAEQAAQLHVFQRTANWVLPRLDRPYRAADRALARVPLYNRAVRQAWFWLLELGRRGFNDGSLMRRSMLKTAAAHLHRAVKDEGLRQKLRPTYALGCKRLMYSNDYYPALAQPNVALVTEPITHITPSGIVTADGQERHVDVLVCATGFDVQHSLAATPIAGRRGRFLSDAWADGPHAHLGLTVAGFPNLFLMLGPNTATGHTSTLLYIEPGIEWALRAMREVQQRGQRWLDIKPSVLQTFNAGLQSRLGDSVWSGCRSWYRAANGKNIAIWPGFTREYVRAVQAQSFEDFEFG